MSNEAVPPYELPPRFPAKIEAPDVQVGFERTSIGGMPIDWVVDQLSTYWEVIDCKHITADFISSGIPVVSIGEVQGRFVDIQRAKHTTPSSYSRLIEGGRKPRPGDLILSRNATVGEVAQVAHWHPPFAMGQDVCLLRKKFPDYSSDFLQSIFRSGIISRQLDNLMVGSTFRRVNVRQVKGLVIPFPRSVEQRAIAETLSVMDELIGALEAVIEKKRAIKQGAMQQLLTGKTRLPGFAGQWETKLLGSVARIKTGSQNNEDKVEDGRYPFFVRSESVERINTYEYECEAILVPGEGRIGNIFHYIEGRFDVHQRVYAITNFASTVVAKFIYYYMAMNFGLWAMQHTVKATVDSLRLPTFQNFALVLPPTIDEQTAIADALSDMDTEIAALEDRRDKTRAIKQGMMQQLLTGRIRLVKPQTAEAKA